MSLRLVHTAVGSVAALAAAASLHPSAQGVCELERFTAAGAIENEWLGWSVGLSIDTAVVGAVYDDDLGVQSGSVHVYRTDGSSWVEEQKLTAPDGGFTHLFGWSADVSGDVAVVGAPGAGGVGAAYVFRRSGGVWSFEQKLASSGAVADYSFGRSVAIHGPVIAIGSAFTTWSGDKGEIQLDGGLCQVFLYDGSAWNHVQDLAAAPGVEGDDFGHVVDVFGGTVAVGAPAEDARGSASVFRHDGVRWVFEQKVTDPVPQVGDNFGFDLSIHGNVLCVGAYYDDEVGQTDSGSVSAFRFDGTAWLLEQELVAPDAAAGDRFGRAVSVSGDALLVGAHLEDDQGSNAGSAYLLRHDGIAWTFGPKVQGADTSAGDQFGEALALDGAIAVVGARANDLGVENAGAAYAFDVDSDACLAGDPPSISLVTGGAQSFALDADGQAGKLYLLLGSAGGVAPGTSIDGTVIPLNVDVYTLFTLGNANGALLPGSFGVLDGAGEASAALVVPAGTDPGLAGLTLHHAFAVIDPLLVNVVAASNPVAVALEP